MSYHLGLATLDYAIIGIYFFVVLAIGLWIGSKTKSGTDLFLAGRSLRWPAIGFSLFASNISSTTLIGLIGAAYAGGLYVSNYEWMAAVVLVFMTFTFIPIFLRTKISTIPEFLERRFGRSSRRYFSALTIFTSVFVDTAGALYAGAVVLKAFFPELDLGYTCMVLAVVAGLYTAAGGLAAVVYTDMIQAVVLLAGAVLLTYMVFSHPNVDFSIAAIKGSISGEMFHVLRPIDDPHLPWLGTLIGVPILGFYFWCNNQYIIQRVLGARSVDDARWGALFGGLLKLPVLFIMVLPGLVATMIFPDVPAANQDQIFPMMVTQLLPVGIVGLVMAGLVAAIMSSIDSTLNSTSALVTFDFVKVARPDISEKSMANVGRLVMGIVMVVSALFAPMIAHMGGLFAYLQEALAFIVPPVTVIFIMGVFSKRGNARSALMTMLIGHGFSIGVFALQKMEILPAIHFTIVAGLLFAVSVGIFFITSRGEARKTDAELADLLVGNNPPPQPGLKNYKLQGAALLTLTFAIVAMFSTWTQIAWMVSGFALVGIVYFSGKTAKQAGEASDEVLAEE